VYRRNEVHPICTDSDGGKPFGMVVSFEIRKVGWKRSLKKKMPQKKRRQSKKSIQVSIA